MMKLVVDDPDLTKRYEREVPDADVTTQREALLAFARECQREDPRGEENLSDDTALQYAVIEKGGSYYLPDGSHPIGGVIP